MSIAAIVNGIVRVQPRSASHPTMAAATTKPGRPIDPGIDYAALAAATEGRSAAAITAAINRAALVVLNHIAGGKRGRVITEADLRSALSSTGGRDRPLAADWRWEDVVLPAATKQQLQQLHELVRDPTRAQRFGITPPSGALLYGPPGTGKTTIAKVLAAQANTSFYPLKSSDLLSKWVGESEQNVAQVFARARENAPSIIFLDEIDSLAPRRGSTFDSGVGDRVLNQLLAEIDGLKTRPGVFVLGATNRKDLIDEPMLRGGRLETHIEIGLPDAGGRLALLQLFTKAMPLAADVSCAAIAAVTDGVSPADLRKLCQEAGLRAMLRAGAAASAKVTGDDFNAVLAATGRQSTVPQVPVKWW
jgi:transitional endoplasmic reticulum ATPase